MCWGNITQYTAHSNDIRINTIIWNIWITSAYVFIVNVTTFGVFAMECWIYALITFIISVRPPLCPYLTRKEPLNPSYWNLIWEILVKHTGTFHSQQSFSPESYHFYTRINNIMLTWNKTHFKNSFDDMYS
jgi:hypothetical protein